jgi:hypothetical protein
MTKAVLCVACNDIRSPSNKWNSTTDRPWRWCACEHVAVRWRDGHKGTLEVVSLHGPEQIRVIGLNNHFLRIAIGCGETMTDDQWRDLHARQGDAPGYLFDSGKRDCWALVVRVGQSGDVFLMDYTTAREEARTR